MKSLAFAGFSIDTDTGRLMELYPSSRHWTSDHGTYLVWISAKEARYGIYYVQLDRDESNRMRKLTLRFEVPMELRESVRGRSCSDILASIVARYGPAMDEPKPWSEEAARHEPKVWFDAMSRLTFDCAEYAVVIEPRQRASR
ncbi:MAG: hypothetical protein QOK37_4606 [Thermoanaerobaculia bacterium]|jgi:hypothetical protein|nr:hypothetical protein [Thermoanaerobaculia bacterium]